MLNLLLNFNLILSATAIFSPNSLVVSLGKNNFDKLVLKSERVWFVKFYAPWCQYCQEFAPEFERAAEALKGVVRLGAVNVEEEQALGNTYGVQSYPVVRIFILDKRNSEEFRGKRDADTLVNAAMVAVQRKVNHQLSGKPDPGPRNIFKHVVKLTDNNFKDLVLNSNDMWMINFYAPWCKTCQRFEPTWIDAAMELEGKVKFGSVDITTSRLTTENYKIKHYPTIKYFPVGFKNEIFDYTLKRYKSELVQFAMKIYTESKPAKKIKQLISNNTFEKVCAQEQLCIISFLPHFLDCASDCRRAYLKILRRNSEKFKERTWGWLWSEATAQSELEKVFDIGGFGYPAMVVLNLSKMMYTTLRGAFSEEGIGEFLRDLTYGRGSVADLRGKIEIIEVKAWDGTDSNIIKEEDEVEEINNHVNVKSKEEIEQELDSRTKLEEEKVEKKPEVKGNKNEKSAEYRTRKESENKMESEIPRSEDEIISEVKEADFDKRDAGQKPNLKDTPAVKLPEQRKDSSASDDKQCSKETECSEEKTKGNKYKKSSNNKKANGDDVLRAKEDEKCSKETECREEKTDDNKYKKSSSYKRTNGDEVLRAREDEKCSKGTKCSEEETKDNKFKKSGNYKEDKKDEILQKQDKREEKSIPKKTVSDDAELSSCSIDGGECVVKRVRDNELEGGSVQM